MVRMGDLRFVRHLLRAGTIIIAFLLDLLIVLGLVTYLFLLLTDGGTYIILGHSVKFHSTRNAVVLLLAASALRLTVMSVPFLAIPRLSLSRLPAAAHSLGLMTQERLPALSRRAITVTLATMCGVQVLLKAFNAWHYYGFFSGDDVEIHEMSLKAAGRIDAPIWEIRNAFFPLAIVYPFQALAIAVGIDDPALLVFAGRLAGILFSTANTLLVYRIGSAELGPAAGLLAAGFFTISKNNLTFGSTELPRPIATTFILWALLLAQSGLTRWTRLVLSALAAAAGMAMRFTEAVFIVPFWAYLAARRQYVRAFATSAAALVFVAAIIGATDYAYWGRPFHSLASLHTHTFESRHAGDWYEPPLFYIAGYHRWTDLFTIAFALFSLRCRRSWVLAAWVVVPLVLLSCLPHKEVRYVIPVVPFLSILAGAGLWEALRWATRSISGAFRNPLAGANSEAYSSGKRGPSLNRMSVVAFCVAGAVLPELGGFRFHRTEAAVDLARHIAAQANVEGAIVHDLWKAGGRIYLSRVPALVNLTDDSLSDLDALERTISNPRMRFVGLRERALRSPEVQRMLEAAGFDEVAFTARRDRNDYRLFERRH